MLDRLPRHRKNRHSAMLPPIPLLSDFDISPANGFLPTELPLELLPDLYYHKWETIVGNLQALLLSKRLRGVIERLPILATTRLKHVSEWRRAYMLLAFMTHAYIWGGDKPQEVTGEWTPVLARCTDIAAESTTVHINTIPQSVRSTRITSRSNVRRCRPMELQAHLFRRTHGHSREPVHPDHIHRLPR